MEKVLEMVVKQKTDVAKLQNLMWGKLFYIKRNWNFKKKEILNFLEDVFKSLDIIIVTVNIITL